MEVFTTRSESSIAQRGAIAPLPFLHMQVEALEFETHLVRIRLQGISINNWRICEDAEYFCTFFLDRFLFTPAHHKCLVIAGFVLCSILTVRGKQTYQWADGLLEGSAQHVAEDQESQPLTLLQTVRQTIKIYLFF